MLFQAAGGFGSAGPLEQYLGQIELLLSTLIWVIVPLLLGFFVIWVILSYNSYRYELTDKEFRKEFGIIRKRYVSIPYDQIQNVDIHRGITDRLLGLSELHIQTAGQSDSINAAEGILPGLSKEEAEAIRNELVHQAHINT